MNSHTKFMTVNRFFSIRQKTFLPSSFFFWAMAFASLNSLPREHSFQVRHKTYLLVSDFCTLSYTESCCFFLYLLTYLHTCILNKLNKHIKNQSTSGQPSIILWMKKNSSWASVARFRHYMLYIRKESIFSFRKPKRSLER